MRQDDVCWFLLIRWVYFALLEAEELEISKKNVLDLIENSQNPAIRRFLGLDGKLGEKLGLGKDWAFNIVRNVGNYGDIFQQHLSARDSLGIARGINNLWKERGLMYSPPMK